MKDRHHLVILDMFLSGFNGVDICRHLKNDSQTCNLPVQMMSGQANALEKCRAAEADDFMSKPFELSELLNKVSRLTSMVNS